jgi:hypothetical protein
LDGTYKMPNAGAAAVEVTELQQSIFNAPAPGTAASAAPSGLPSKSAAPGLDRARDAGTPDRRGTKRPRNEEEEDGEEEESDDDVAMEEDSDDE